MGLFLWIILGWFTGLLANWIMGVKDRGSLIVNWLLGIAGALLGGLLGSAFGHAAVSSPDLRGLLIAVGGSVAVLTVYRVARVFLSSI